MYVLEGQHCTCSKLKRAKINVMFAQTEICDVVVPS